MEKYKTLVIVNPNSANGATGKKIGYIKNLLKKTGTFDIKFTEMKGHATLLAKEGLISGFNRIIAVGGDGTFNEVINGFFEEGKPVNPDAVLGIISGGTGADFIKTINFPRDEFSAVERIVNDRIKRIDVGKVTYKMPGGKDKTRIFLNIADAGIGGAVVERVNNTSKIFGGFVSFLVGTVSTVMEYRNKRTRITFDDDFTVDKVTNNIVIGNGKYFGGGMKVLPDAEPDDELFDILIIGDINKAEFFKNIPKIYNGTHIHDPKIDFRRAKKVSIYSEEPLKIDIDGEQEGFTPAEFQIIPKAVNIIV